MGTVISRNVKVSNSPDKPLYVTFETTNGSINVYGESLSVAALGTSTILTYTVAANKILVLKRLSYSGNNIGVYSVEINSTLESRQRAYYTSFNGEFKFENLQLDEGDEISLIVENKSNMIGDFNANLQGSLTDA